MDKPLTTEEINELLKNQPEWLSSARTTHSEQRQAEQQQ